MAVNNNHCFVLKNEKERKERGEISLMILAQPDSSRTRRVANIIGELRAVLVICARIHSAGPEQGPKLWGGRGGRSPVMAK